MEDNPAKRKLRELAGTLGIGQGLTEEFIVRFAERSNSDIAELISYGRSLARPTSEVPGKNIPRSSLHILVLMFPSAPVPMLPQISPTTTASEDLRSTTAPSTSFLSSRSSNRASSRSDLTSTSGSRGPYQCQYCWRKPYAREGDLKNHVWKHHHEATSRANHSRRRTMRPPAPLADQTSRVLTPLQPQDALSQTGTWAGNTNPQAHSHDDRRGLQHVRQPDQYPGSDELQAYFQQQMPSSYSNPQPQGFNRDPASHLLQALNNISPDSYDIGSHASPINQQQQPSYNPGPQQARPPQPNLDYGTMPGRVQMAKTHHAPRQPPGFNNPLHIHVPQAPDGNIGKPDAPTNVTNPTPSHEFHDDVLDNEFDFNTLNT